MYRYCEIHEPDEQREGRRRLGAALVELSYNEEA